MPIVVHCPDTVGPTGPGEQKDPWLLRKRRHLEPLQEVPLDSLLVGAADKAHNARHQMLDARRDPGCWSRVNAGLDGTAWCQLGIHRTVVRRMRESRSTELPGEALRELLTPPPAPAPPTPAAPPGVHPAG